MTLTGSEPGKVSSSPSSRASSSRRFSALSRGFLAGLELGPVMGCPCPGWVPRVRFGRCINRARSLVTVDISALGRAGKSMKHITCVEDLRQLHKRRVPKAFFDYADRGSYTEDTLRANSDDLQQIKFRQRVLVDVSKRDLSTTIIGEKSSLPLILAPVGSTGMQFGDGEIHA